MITQQVAVSAVVGKQVVYVPSAQSSAATSANKTGPQRLVGFSCYSPSGLCNVTIRDGNASGRIEHTANAPSGDSKQVIVPGGQRYDKGMHVTVLGTNAECNLYLE